MSYSALKNSFFGHAKILSFSLKRSIFGHSKLPLRLYKNPTACSKSPLWRSKCLLWPYKKPSPAVQNALLGRSMAEEWLLNGKRWGFVWLKMDFWNATYARGNFWTKMGFCTAKKGFIKGQILELICMAKEGSFNGQRVDFCRWQTSQEEMLIDQRG